MSKSVLKQAYMPHIGMHLLLKYVTGTGQMRYPFNLHQVTVRILKRCMVVGCVLLASLLNYPAFAQSSTTNLQFAHLLSEQGVSVGSVETIHQDHLGYMWFGGLDG